MKIKLTLSALRLHQIMYTMIYPAVLGAFIYTYWDKVAKAEFSWADPSLWFCGFLFIALFTLDYIYSISDAVLKNYSAPEFFFDFVITVLLFAAAQKIFGTSIKSLECITVWEYLIAIKLVASAWELARYLRLKMAAKQGSPIKFQRALPLLPLATDILFLGIALLLGFISRWVPVPYQFVLVAFFLIGDGIFYIANTSDA